MNKRPSPGLAHRVPPLVLRGGPENPLLLSDPPRVVHTTVRGTHIHIERRGPAGDPGACRGLARPNPVGSRGR